MTELAGPRLPRPPIFYGWVIVAAAFVTMAVGVNARTAFSLLFPPILDEFGWDRGLAAGVFSLGFVVSAIISPAVGRLMGRCGPRPVVELGVFLLGAGLLLSTLAHTPWQIYATLGVLVGAGANCLGYTVQSLFLRNWFARRRGLAMGIAFSGVGVGSIILLPLLQTVIEHDGWRAACGALGVSVIVLLAPLNLVLKKRPEDLGLRPDGASVTDDAGTGAVQIVDQDWAAIEWTLGRAVRTKRFWWIALGYFCGLFAWYAVQVHQTKYLIETGFTALHAAWALGLVSLVAIPGQIALGHLSDRIGREWVWAIACAGFALCYLALIALQASPMPLLLYVMVVAQGTLGYSLTSVIGPVAAEIFEGPHFGSIFGVLMLAAIAGGAAGPWLTGVLHDVTESYAPAFWLSVGLCGLSAAAIWIAAPRTVRLVPGRVRNAHAESAPRAGPRQERLWVSAFWKRAFWKRNVP